MRLLIVRHGIAIPRETPDIPDDERTLTPRGVKRFRSAARGLARIMKPPDLLLSSPLPRARQTADIAAKAWKGVKVKEEEALGGGSVQEMATALGKLPPDATVGIFGHEPGLSELLAWLRGTPHADRLTLKKGGAALLEIPGLLAEGGVLIWYAPPRLLRLAG